MKKSAPERSILPVTLGTAGHIDHGKTTLLRALSGDDSDTDRLAEEKERGLTIDVGYAELALDDGVEVGVVDVPGHEKFVRNMVAGATGIDVVLLVVAADDGVMPQTREHLQIMSLLGLTQGIIAITKADLVDEEMLELVASDVADLVAGTFLEDAAMIPVSSVSGLGIDALRCGISTLVRAAPRRDADGYFRMPVLRVFTSHGFGTIVTGIPLSGRLNVGDRIDVQPNGRRGRVRGLQVYHRPAADASAGHRTAINIAELEHRKVTRGDVICAPGVFSGAELLDVRIELLPNIARPLRHNQEARLHVGTVECDCRVLLVGARTLAPGATGYAQLKLSRPAVTAPGDRYILRLPAQLTTLGGGVVLGPGAHRRRRRRPAAAREFEEREQGLTDLPLAIQSALRRAALEGTTPADLAFELKRRPEEIASALDPLLADGRALQMDRGPLLDGESAQGGSERLLAAIERAHEQNPLDPGTKKALLAAQVGASTIVADGLVAMLVENGRVETLPGGRVRLAAWQPQLTAAQQDRVDRILAALSEEPWQTPRSHALAPLVGGLPQEIDKLLELLEGRGDVVRLRDGILFTTETIETAKAGVREHLGDGGTLAPADMKRLFGITRKYGIPLLEYFDKIGFTRRDGDKRLLKG